MNSSKDSRCSHRLGFPIRKSPDHGLLASPRGLSQLATSFIAYLRQGIHTHALSSLTIKFTLDTEYEVASGRWPVASKSPPVSGRADNFALLGCHIIGFVAAIATFVVARQYSDVKDHVESAVARNARQRAQLNSCLAALRAERRAA